MAGISLCAFNVALSNCWSQSRLNISPWTWPGMRPSKGLAAAPWRSLCLSRGTEHMFVPHCPLGTSRALFIERHAPPVKKEGADSILRYWYVKCPFESFLQLAVAGSTSLVFL